MGVSPHLLVQTVHEGRAQLLGGCPPLSFWLGSCPYLPAPSQHDVRLGRTLLWGSPLVVGGEEGAPPAVHAVSWERTLLGGCPFLLLHPLAPVDPPLLLGHAVR